MRWQMEETSDQLAFRQEFRAWLAETLPAGWSDAVEAGDDAALEKIKAAAGFNPFAWQGTIGRSPYAAPLWPKEYGGLSGEVWMQQVIRSELVRHRLPTVSINLLGVGLAGPTLIEHGSEAQKERYLRKILSGEEIWCQLFSEPGSGSDLASLATRAVRDGDDYVISGQKVWTSLAHWADWGFAIVRTEPGSKRHKGLSYLLVPMREPGIELRPIIQATGTSEFNEVFFDGARSSVTNLVGSEGDGWKIGMATLGFERGSMTLGQQVGFRRELERIIELAQRTGAADNPAIRQRLSNAWIGVEIMRLNALRTLSTSGRDLERTASIGKLYWSTWHRELGELAMDVLGMSATVVEEAPYELRPEQSLFLFSRSDTIYAGSSEIQRNIIAERSLGLPKEPTGA